MQTATENGRCQSQSLYKALSSRFRFYLIFLFFYSQRSVSSLATLRPHQWREQKLMSTARLFVVGGIKMKQTFECEEIHLFVQSCTVLYIMNFHFEYISAGMRFLEYIVGLVRAFCQIKYTYTL